MDLFALRCSEYIKASNNIEETANYEMKIMFDKNLLIGNEICELYIELTDFTNKSNLSNASFEVILSLSLEKENQNVRLIADNDKVDLRFGKIEDKIYVSLDEILNGQKIETFTTINLSQNSHFEKFVNQKIKNVEFEKYLDGEINGMRITLENNSIFEVFPNDYMTSGHFYNVAEYFPEKIKYLAGKTIWE